MAGKPKKKTSTTRKKRVPARETKSTLQAKKQMWAVVLFALGLLLLFLTVIKGEKLWLSIHNLLFGLFGWSVYFLAPLMLYIAVIAARDKPLSTIKTKLWQVMVLIVMISGAIQISGGGMPDEGSLVENIIALFEGGKTLQGGGIAGAVFALPLIALFEKTGATIIIWLAIGVFIMLITGSTLISLFHSATRPVKGIEEAYADAVETRQERAAVQRQAAVAAKAAAPAAGKFSFDVDISGDSDPTSSPPGSSFVVDPRNDPDIPPEDLPGHPVISQRAESENDNRTLAEILADSPVEYISTEEFAPRVTPVPEAAPAPQPAADYHRAHPLDAEILKAETEAADTSAIEDIIDRFITGERPHNLPPIDCLDDAPDLAQGPIVSLGIEPETANDEADGPAYALRTGRVDLQSAATTPPEYKHPPISLLATAKAASSEDITEELKNNAQNLVDTLKSFGVQTRITDICRGPAVTRYELQPSAGVKISKITGLADDIALNLASAGIRIEAPIPNKAAVGIEVPNKIVSIVSIREIIDSNEFVGADSSLAVALGKDIAGNVTLADLGKMPHMLIAGATGSGKSVCINSIIVSILYKSSPDEVKLLMVDPKVVELGIYNGIPHLLVPVVTDPKKAAGALGWAVTEMLNRYKTFADNSVRDLAGYNRLAHQSDTLQPMPKIVIIIDELADLMMAAPNEVEDSICRLAQMARAAGMHLVIATQRPSVDVITGVIKANIPSRVAFAVSSQVDSRTILDMGGAEKLLGRGDMLFYPVGASKPIRVQGCFVTDSEVEKVVNFVKEGDPTAYDQSIVEQIDRHVVADKSSKDSGGGFDDEDEMLPQAIECVVEAGQASTSQLQRRLKLGYARAARIIDQLEVKGIVGPFEGSKPRQVMISKDRWMEMKLSGAEDSQLKLSGVEAPRPEPAMSLHFEE